METKTPRLDGLYAYWGKKKKDSYDTIQDPGAKENYELCINSSIGVEQTVNLIYNYIDKRI